MRLNGVAPLIAAVFLLAAPAFTQTDFEYQPYATPNGGNVALSAPNAHVADFNGDGLADVLAASPFTCTNGTCNQPAALDLYMNNGDGLNPPVQLPVTPEGGSFLDLSRQVTVSDFNGDGKLDIAALNASGGITILYGNGDGTFQAPVNIQLPPATYSSLMGADFDVNNTQDLAALGANGTLVLLFNDGKGNFTQQPVTIDTPPSGYTDAFLVVGDFNADGRPDIAWVEQGNASNQTNTVYSELNTAKGVFSTKQEVGTTPAGFGAVLAADLDLDGKSDLITWTTQLVEQCCQDLPLMAYYSNGDGTFTAGTTVASISTDDAGVTDINGDGNPDILVAGFAGVSVYTGNGDRTFTGQGTYSSLPGGAQQLGFGFFNTTDQMGFAAPNAGAPTGSYPNDFYLVANENPQGNCAYPASAGVTFCQAAQTGGSAHVRGTARAQTQPVQHIELWANGKKLYQVFSDEFNTTLAVNPGTPITAVEVESNGATRSTTVTPSSACTAPSAPGVNVCSPAQGSTVTSPVTFTASGTGASGTVNHLELWVDGTKVGNYGGSAMNTQITEPAGSHTAQVVEVDSKGAYVKSTPVTYTVGTSGACAAPSAPGVNVCSPAQGSTVTSPVTFIASGTGASGAVNHLELWIDGTKIGNYSGSTMDTQVSEAAGSHSAQVVEVDSAGAYVKSVSVTFSVGTSGACAAPSSAGVNVCSPAPGEITPSPVTIAAAGTGASGAVNHLELWMDGTKIGNYSGSQMSTSVTLADGSHTAQVVEVDSQGNYVRSAPVTFTVGTSNGCAAPGAPGVNVCSPTQGETTASPVSFLATGKGASGAVNHLELWVDGNKAGNYSGATMNAKVAFPAGSHTATIIEVDSQFNYVKSSPVTFTVQ